MTLMHLNKRFRVFCLLGLALPAQAMHAQETALMPADKPQTHSSAFESEAPLEQTSSPDSGNDQVTEWIPTEDSEPLIEVASSRTENVREAAAPIANAEGEYLSADLVDAALLSGPGYSLTPRVEVRGYMLHYTLSTRFGDITAEGNDLLPIRIDEVAAIERLDETGLARAAGKQAAQRGKDVWQGLKRVVTKPKETAVALPQGVARMIKTRVQKIGRQASKLYDKSRDKLAEDDSQPAPTGPLTAARAPKPEPDPNISKTRRKARKEGMNLVKQETNFSSTRRFIAREVAVDPYSSNPVLKQKLDALAWSATSSNMGVDLLMKSLGAATLGVVPNLLKVDRIVWEETPENIAEENRKRLNALGCAPELTRRFVRNGAFSPTLQTSLVNALETLKLPRGCDEVLAMAIDAKGEIESRFMVNSLSLLLAAPLPGRVGYAPGECEIESLGGGLGARCQGELIVPVPVDALIWDQDMASFLNAEDVRDARARTLLITGFADDEARKRLTERGFAIVEHAPLQ